MPPARSPDTIRILVSSDNHVGYEGRDPIRKDDSWRTFDEIMQIAKKEDVDMVLLGGDLFHDNQPARKFMYQVMRSLRKNCLGMRPCELDFLSDAAEVFEGSAFPHVNYQDPDINISIPVFSIHGNHDEPSGDGHYCSLDLLQVAGLVNYFGRVPETDNVQAKPVLLQKGNTKLALYGLSNVREERMHHTFRSNKVHFYRPKQQQSDFFNLLVVHQNHYAHTANGYLPEEMLPDWMNLVVWGHEHECLIEPRENPQTKFHVMQPGSSVATSLVPGEAVTKQVAIVSLTGTSFTSEAIPLKTVRPMVTRELVLATDKRFKGLDKKKDNKQEVTKRLIAIVEEMIGEATENWLSLRERDADDEDEDEDEQEPPLPLIRLKVEYTAVEGGKFEIENPQRFSNRFIGKVANTNDVVYFYRKKKNILGKLSKNGVVVPREALEALEAAADGRDAVKIEAIIREYFAAQSLRLLPQAPFGDAVSHFVNNSDKNRMTDFVVNELANQVQELLAMDEEEGQDLGGSIERIRKKAEEDFLAGERRAGNVRRLKPKPADWDSDMEGHWVNNPDAYDKAPARESLATGARGQPAKTAAKPKAKSRAARDDEDDEDGDVHMEDDEEPEPRPKGTRVRPSAASKTTKAAAKKAEPAKKPPARTRRPVRGGFIDEDSDEDEQLEQEEDDVVMDDEEDEFEAVARPAPAKKRAAAPAPKRAQSTTTRARTAAKPAAKPVAKARQTTLNFSQRTSASAAVGRSQQTALEISDDEIEEDDAFESMPTMPTTRRR